MKKIILSLAACLVSIIASAYTLETPVVWTENFYKMGDGSNYPSSDWITYGNGADVNDLEKFMFENPKDGPYFVIFDQGSQSMAMATTDFVGNVPADQWLVSPEVEIPYDNMTLALDVCTYTFKGQLGVYPPTASSGVNPYRIMISESGGVEKSDFKEIFSGSVNSDLTKETFESYERVFNVNGYKGKKVRFAFVVTGSNNGMTGFTNIRLGQYTFAVTSDMNSPYAEVGKPISIDFNTRMKAPVPTPYLNCEVYINDEKVKEQKIKSAFGSVTSYKTVLKRIQMENVYTPESDDPIVYKLVVTPDFEGAIPSVIEGGIVFQKVTYPSNVVVEEFTGSQCGWCPRGISALEYYHDTYKGSENQGKTINIGIHSSALGTDPMATGVERYLSALAELGGAKGLPGAIFNRSSNYTDPTNAGEVDRQIALPSNNTAKILKVEMPENAQVGDKIKVTVEVKNGYDAQRNNIALAIVLLENNIQVNSSLYNQKNYLNTYPSAQDVYDAMKKEGFGGLTEAMIPYFAKFVSTGEFNTDPIPYSKMIYQHVARGIFPSFSGETLNPEWVADVAQNYTLEFAIPSNVLKTENLEVVALVLNNDTRGRIVASDNMGIENFTLEGGSDGVESIANDSDIKVSNESGELSVIAPAGSVAEVYSLDGMLLGTYNVDGALKVKDNYQGVVVVKVINSNETKTAKVIF